MIKYTGIFTALYVVVGLLLLLIFNMMEWERIELQFLLTIFIAANLAGVKFVKENGVGFSRQQRMAICVQSLAAFWLISIIGGSTVLYGVIEESQREVILLTLGERSVEFFLAFGLFVSGIVYMLLFVAYGPLTDQYAKKNRLPVESETSNKVQEESNRDSKDK